MGSGLVFNSSLITHHSSLILTGVQHERRRNPRFPVTGRAIIVTPEGELPAELIDIATGSLLMRCRQSAPAGAELPIRFSVENHANEFTVTGRVVRTQPDVLAVVFVDEPRGLRQLIEEIEKRHGAGA
jgi:hypothetical protein